MFTGFRHRRGLTQSEFAKLAGLPSKLISEWEAYKCAPSVIELRDLATAFSVPVADLLVRKPGELSLRYHARTPWAGPKPVGWDAHAQQAWGLSPFAHWGNLRLQLTAGEDPRWYPVSAAQAWWLHNEIERQPTSEVIVGKTLNNRVLAFVVDQLFDASLLSTAQSVGRPDFVIGWDSDGLPPEVYRTLRVWGRNDYREYFAISNALQQRREAILDRPGLRRRAAIAALVDQTRVHRISDKPIALMAEAANLQTALRSLPFGLLTVYLAERASNREWLVPLDDIRLLDMLALDLEEVRLFDVVAAPG